MDNIDTFVRACKTNNIARVRRHISLGVDVNGKYSGSTGLMCAMARTCVGVVTVLLGHRDIQLEITNSYGSTALHFGCDHNRPETVRLFLAHPACTSTIINMVNNRQQTAEMVAVSKGHHDCARLVVPVESLLARLRLGGAGGADGAEQVRPERMTLTQLADAIEKISAIEREIETTNDALESEHAQELENLQREHQKLMENHERKLNTVLDSHATESNFCQTYRAEKQSRKQLLEDELKRRVNNPAPTAARRAPASAPVPASLIPECPVCMDEMKPPLQIFNCGNGHLICSVCRPRVTTDTCHCNAKYSGRATAMEHMIRQILGIM